MPESSPSTLVSLTPHPAAGRGPVGSVDVKVHWHAPTEILSLEFRLAADPTVLRLPVATRPRRVDGLWRHTCFEAFVQEAGGTGYLEFNLAPSGEWAAYRFTARREGMLPLALAQDPVPRLARQARGLRLQASLQIPGMRHGPLRVGLAAVVEAAGGALYYWALRHGQPGAPDFHDPESFTLRLGTDGTGARE